MKRSMLLLAMVAVLVLSSVAAGAIVSVSLPYDKFGHLGNTTINGKGACAATSIINSFRYLENTYPNMYDQKLVPGGD